MGRMTLADGESGGAARIARLERRLLRERKAREAAERTAEDGLRQLYEGQRDQALVGKVAALANHTQDIDVALRGALDDILDRGGWAYGAVHFPAGDEVGLSPAHLTRATDAFLSRLPDLTGSAPIPPGEDPLVRAVETRNAIVTEDIATSAMTFSRRLAAVSCGLHSAIAVPLLSGDQVVAVMELMSLRCGPPRDGYAELLVQIAAQVARVKERADIAAKLQADALRDPLTDLPNRQLLADRLDRAVAAYLHSGIAYAMLFLDLDRFKLINDRLGHGIGDATLLRVTDLLREAVLYDGLAARTTIARIGGDEFCLLIEDAVEVRAIEALAERIIALIGFPMEVGGETVEIGVSLGIAFGCPSFETGDMVIHAADLAMYEAKSAGRSRSVTYSGALEAQSRRRESLLADLKGDVAAECRGFRMVYQPIVTLEDGRITGFEALARWRRRDGETVSPDEFIPLAETEGLIEAIGAWALDHALATLRGWRESETTAGDLTMSVNVSPRQIRPRFVETVKAALDRHDIPADRLGLEITEGLAIEEDDATLETVSQLRAMGVAFSIDDFGTGYASFSYLRGIFFQTLKIDRSFIAEMEVEAPGTGIVRAIVEMARTAGLDLVAEGIETKAQGDILRDLGCGRAQGYYYSHPVTPDEAIGLFRRQSPHAA